MVAVYIVGVANDVMCVGALTSLVAAALIETSFEMTMLRAADGDGSERGALASVAVAMPTCFDAAAVHLLTLQQLQNDGRVNVSVWRQVCW